jgi:hypothetical protein
VNRENSGKVIIDLATQADMDSVRSS